MVSPNNYDSQESANENYTPNEGNRISRLISEYSKDKLKNKNTRSQYVRDLRSAWSITTDILDEIKKFAGKDKKYDGLEIIPEKLNYHSLVRETGWFFITFANQKRSLIDSYITDYDISEFELRKKLDPKLKNISESELENILKSSKTQREYLTQIFGDTNMPIQKSIASFLWNFNLSERYSLLNDEDKVSFQDIVQKIQSWWKLNEVDLEILFETNAYSDSEKAKLIAKFAPSISLAQAMRYGLITDDQAKAFKIESIKQSGENLSNDDISEILEQIRDEDIRVASSHFTNNKNNVDTLISNSEIFRNFVWEYNSMVDEVQSKIQAGNMKKSSDFITALWSTAHVSGLDNLQVGGVIQIKQRQTQDGSEKLITLFGEITSLWDDGIIAFKEKSYDDMFDSGWSVIVKYTYTDFLSFLQNGNPNKWVTFDSLSILSPTELDAKIRSWDIKEYNAKNLKLQSDEHIAKEAREIKQRLEIEEKKLKDRKTELRNKLSDQWISGQEAEDQINQDSWVQKHQTRINELTQSSRDKEGVRVNIWGVNAKTLEEQIDLIDSGGKIHWFGKGTVFQTKKWAEYTYTIKKVDIGSQKVVISSLAKEEEVIDFNSFYQEFEKQDAKRINKQAQSFEELIDRVKKEDKLNSWEQYELNSWQLKRKNVKGWSSNYEYLAGIRGDGSNEVLKIHNINGEYAEVSFWELKEDKVKDKKDKHAIWEDGDKLYDTKFTLETTSYKVTTWFLEEWIKTHKLEPRSLDEKNDVTEADAKINPMEKKFHFTSWLFNNRASLNDAVKWGTIFYEQIKEMLEMWSEEKANQFALKYLGKVMTKDAKRDLQSRLEQKQKKTMEEYLERLETVASDVALEMIEQWLQDKYGAQFQKEAAVVFMLKKYGVLNAKSMSKHEGKWWWYQALWGEVWDSLYNELKKEKENANLPFTEEYAVYILIKRQCHKNGYKGVKRRSKLHKEVKKIRAVWKEEEWETGMRDGKDERDVMWRIKWGMEEMKSGNYPNMGGWMERVVEKWGPMHAMNKIPFCAAFSWVAYSFEEKFTDQLKWLPGSSKIMMMLRFFSYKSDLDLLNKTIVEVCSALWEKNKTKYGDMTIKAKELFSLIDNPDQKWLEDRINRVEDFYDQYGEIITKVMYGLDTGEEWDIYNKLIFLEKDNQDNSKRAQIFTQYFESLTWYMRASETVVTDKDLMTDAFLNAGTSGMDTYKMTKELLIMKQWGWVQKDIGPDMWKEMKKEFQAIPKREYGDINTNKKILEYKLRGFLAGIMGKMQNAKELAGYNNTVGPFAILNKWGVDMTWFQWIQWFNVDYVLKWWNANIDAIVHRFVDNIMNAELHGMSYYDQITSEFAEPKREADTLVDSIPNSTKKNTQRKVSQITSGDDFFDDIPSWANDDVSDILDRAA